MKIYQKFLSVFVLLIMSMFLVSSQCLALQGQAEGSERNATEGAAVNNAGTSFPNPLGSISTPKQFIGKIIDSILGIVGSIALIMFIYGGFLWMTAMGNSKQVGEGQETIKWAALGLVVIFFSYAMVKFIFSAIGA